VARTLKLKTAKILFLIISTVLIALNGLTFASALPLTGGTQILCFANRCTQAGRDFSAYYEASFRFLFNPSHVYSPGKVVLENGTIATSQNFRYAPFFLPVFIVPFVLAFDFTHALIAFDIVQFLLLPLVAYLLFDIMVTVSGRKRNVEKGVFAIFSFSLFATILQPFIPTFSSFTYWSWSYFRLWEEGEARLLQTALLILTIYLVMRNSKFSGIPFVLSSFDPRMSLLCLPLVLYLGVRNKSLSKFVLSSIVSVLILYIPTLLYANLGVQFLATMFIRPFLIYSYEWIPMVAIISLTGAIVAIESSHMILNFEFRYGLLFVIRSKLVNIRKMSPISFARRTMLAEFPSNFGDCSSLHLIRARLLT
jgi:hypothetical protein